MTTLPTYAECAAVPPGKRTALQTFICNYGIVLVINRFMDNQPLLDQLAAVIEEERKARADIIDALLDHCPDMECAECGRIVCPHHDPMHFHHDGCPSCATKEPTT